jgi:hypothetical protein
MTRPAHLGAKRAMDSRWNSVDLPASGERRQGLGSARAGLPTAVYDTVITEVTRAPVVMAPARCASTQR